MGASVHPALPTAADPSQDQNSLRASFTTSKRPQQIGTERLAIGDSTSRDLARQHLRPQLDNLKFFTRFETLRDRMEPRRKEHVHDLIGKAG
jgi:hypothetical protein